MGIIENRDAQFILLAGFIIAISLVITTALLNSIIFESTVAGEAGVDPLKYDLANFMQISGDEMKSAYGNATKLSGTEQKKINNFSIQMQNFSKGLQMIYALHGEGVNVSWDAGNWNNSRYANFTENGTANGAANWTVIENVQNVSVFELRNVNITDTNFMVYVTNQTTGAFLWSMQLNDTAKKNVRINYAGCLPASQCPKGFDVGDYTFINLLRSFNPSDYEFGAFDAVAGNIYKIEFLNGTDASGKFFLNGTASGRNFTRARDYIMNATVTLSTSRMRVNITLPVSVP